jgi:hypothetical protein
MLNIMKNKVLFVSLVAAMSSTAFASETTDEIALLREQVKLLTQRLDALEKKSQVTSEKQIVLENKVHETTIAAKPTTDSWTDRVSYKADFRDRYEYIDQKGKVVRQRNRVRLRAQLGMQVNDKLGFTLGLATGADDPVSTNQSLDGGFSTKDMRLDLAFFDYQFNDVFSLTGGKMKNPFHRSGKNPIFWDSDLNPEGFALKFNNDFMHGAIVGFDVEERKAADDTLMFGAQVMHDMDLSGNTLIAGAGYYDYSNLKGNTPLFDGKPRGNSVDAAGKLINDYNMAELFLEYKSKLANQPLSVYGNYYQNTAADNLDTAYTVGFKVGKVKNAGSWDVGLAYLDVEADAVVGLFNDSDFAGGNTDSTGLLFKAGYGLQKNMALGLTYINSEIGQSKAQQTPYDRLQLDFKIKFK